MKSFVVSAILLSCLVATSLGAAVEPLDVAAEEVVEVELTTAINTECHQPKEIGRCFAIFKRFAFNAETHLCEEFIYGGCAGNTNNFETKEECEAKCLQKMVAAETEVELEAELETEAPVVEEKPEVVVEEKPEIVVKEKPEIVIEAKPEIKAL